MRVVQSILIRILDRVYPGLAGKLVYHLFSNPQIQKVRSREKSVLDEAHQWTEPFRKFIIKCYRWGSEKGIPVLLVHGWEGHTGNFAALVKPLIERGYCVLGFDAPAHGESSSGKTEMLEYATFLQGMFTTFNPRVVISHSFGTTSAALALRALLSYPLDDWVMIASPHTFDSRIETFRKLFNVPPRTLERLRNHFEHQSGERIGELNFEHYQPFLFNVKNIHIIHSRSDSVVPYNYARDIHEALSQSILIPLDNLGHFGILWSPELIRQIQDNLQFPSIDNKS